jgi:hypothetical protein
VIVIYRDIWGKDMLAAIERWRARDKIVIADGDAAYDLLPIEHEYYPFMDGREDQGTQRMHFATAGIAIQVGASTGEWGGCAFKFAS